MKLRKKSVKLFKYFYIYKGMYVVIQNNTKSF